ncbi:phosphoribosylanthranilate isomerase [Leifsonia sp. NPDC058292]|uniref:phosphoribosylanthranilate isomerase n=1 Tax=Leifsonia sp. NPDC058292 TaxID=3346428 RepID=UPI0036DB4B15
MWVKVCGLTDAESVEAAVSAGADAVGFVFAPGSPRLVDALVARDLAARAVTRAGARERQTGVLTVGVFRNQPVAEVARLATEAGLDVVQLHGAETAADHAALQALGWPTIRAMAARDYTRSVDAVPHPADQLLLDAPEPGAGETFDGGHLVTEPPNREWILAGGLTPRNVADRIRELQPWGVDVSSGVELAPGRKSPELIAQFVAAARR